MLFRTISLSYDLFCNRHINDVIKISFTLLSLHCRPIFTIHSVFSFSVSCLFPIPLQPKCSIKSPAVFTYVSNCSKVAPVNSLNRVLHLFNFELNSFLGIPLIILVPRIYAFQPNVTVFLKSCYQLQ